MLLAKLVTIISVILSLLRSPTTIARGCIRVGYAAYRVNAACEHLETITIINLNQITISYFKNKQTKF